MKSKFVLIMILVCSSFYSFANAQSVQGEYGLHLFFNEKEFIDVMTLYVDSSGDLRGDMDVPNDFDGKLENIKFEGQKLSFELFVPRNSARPIDLVFYYEGTFFNKNNKQFIGFATLKGKDEFLDSFVGFKRD